MTSEVEHLYAKATARPWSAEIWRHAGKPDTVCIYSPGRAEIIGWTGFDGVPCTKEQIRANAKLVAYAVNNIERLEAHTTSLSQRLEAAVNALEPFALHIRDDVLDDTLIETVAWTARQHRAALAALKTLRADEGGGDV